MVGSFLGVFGALQTLVLGSIAGSVIGYSYIKLTGKDPASYELPFGTFLGAAALVVAVFANQLLAMEGVVVVATSVSYLPARRVRPPLSNMSRTRSVRAPGVKGFCRKATFFWKIPVLTIALSV